METDLIVFTRSVGLPKLLVKADNTYHEVLWVYNFRGIHYYGYDIFVGFEICFSRDRVDGSFRVTPETEFVENID